MNTQKIHEKDLIADMNPSTLRGIPVILLGPSNYQVDILKFDHSKFQGGKRCKLLPKYISIY